MYVFVAYWRAKYFKGRYYDWVFHLQVDHACGRDDDEKTFWWQRLPETLEAHLQLPNITIEFAALYSSMESRPWENQDGWGAWADSSRMTKIAIWKTDVCPFLMSVFM